jgi:BirA family biotin operon repressor/biotin-[acetyl-CoA-carboxylase] ligase
MTSSELLTPDYIQQLINEDEIPLRCKKFDPDMVKSVLRYGDVVGSAIEHYPHVLRGMDMARRLILKTEEENRSFHTGLVILADEMTQSKGRFKRSWHAPKGGLWMTLVMVNTLLPESSLLFPMAAGVSCCEVLRYYGMQAQLKWVNDVLVDSRKIAGILTETFTGHCSGEEYVLFGIGINVNNSMFPPEISEKAASVKSCLNREVSISELAARLLAKLRWNFGLLYYEEARNLEVYGGVALRHEPGIPQMPANEHLLLQSYKSLTDIFNRRVIFGFDVQEHPQFEARVVGLDNSGGLILEMDDSSRIIQHSGEIIYLD